MNKKLLNDLENTRSLIEQTKEQSLHFINNINDRSTSVNKTVDLSTILPDEGLGGEQTLNLFNKKFESIMVASTGPRYWGFVTGGSTPAALMGDMLATFYDQNTQGLKGQGDVSAQIEKETINLLLDLFELPSDYFGGFVTGATMSNFTCLGVARQWYGKEIGVDFAKEGINQNLQIFDYL